MVISCLKMVRSCSGKRKFGIPYSTALPGRMLKWPKIAETSKSTFSINIVFGPTPVAVTNDITNQLKTVETINSAIKNEPVHLPCVAQRPTRIRPLSCSRTPLCFIGVLQLGGSACGLRIVYGGRVSNSRYGSAILPGAIATACFRYAPLIFLYRELC